MADKYKKYMSDIAMVAEKAGNKILDIYSRMQEYNVKKKNDNTPLTEADILSHQIVMEGLKDITPDLPVLSEEGNTISYEKRKQWRKYWLVDPLDGTKEFIAKNSEFTINIALIENHKPVFGLIYVPVKQLYYFAASGEGAFKQEKNKDPVAIKTSAWKPGKIIVAVSRHHSVDRLDVLFSTAGEYEIITRGSSLKFALIAEGKADIYPRMGPTSEWDTAAGQCIIEEAGGIVVDLSFEPLRYNTKDSLINPSFLVIGDPSHAWRKQLNLRSQ